MCKIQNWEELLFIKKNGCSFGFDRRVTREPKTMTSFVPNVSCVQYQECIELTQENTLRIIMLKDFVWKAHFAVRLNCLTKQRSNPLSISWWFLEKHKLSSYYKISKIITLIVYYKIFKTKLTQKRSSQIDRHTQNKCTSCDTMVKWTRFRVNIQFAEDKCRKLTFLKNKF